MINKTTLALDVSTSVIGICLFDADGILHKMDHVKFGSNKEQDLYEKADIFEKKVADMKRLELEDGTVLEVQYVAIEEPLLRIQGKHSSASTIGLLNFFNGIISDRCFRLFGVRPVHYNVNHARSVVFPNMPKSSETTAKQEVWKRVARLEPQINWWYGPKSRKLLDENYDMVDAYVVGVCHILNIMQQEDAEPVSEK
jgi:hypothetical protein